MTLYLLDICGVFATGFAPLPADVNVIPAAEQATLDGRSVAVVHGRVQIPALSAGKHVLTVNGKSVGFVVQNGEILTELDPNVLLPTVARLLHLEKRIKAIEKKLADNEVDWLK